MTRLRYTLLLISILIATTGCDREQTTSPRAQDPEAPNARPQPRPVEQVAAQPVTTPATTLEELPEGVNALQNEMRALNPAMHTILTAIANDQLEAIPPAIKKVHPTRQVTMQAIEKGLYQPPQNADDMEGFAKLDDTFHDNLKALMKASKGDDLQGATDAYKSLIQGCTDCHSRYRFAPTTK